MVMMSIYLLPTFLPILTDMFLDAPKNWTFDIVQAFHKKIKYGFQISPKQDEWTNELKFTLILSTTMRFHYKNVWASCMEQKYKFTVPVDP